MGRNSKKFLSVALVTIYVSTQVAFGNVAEPNFWAERRIKNTRSESQQKAPQFAALPTSFNSFPNNLLKQLPSIGSTLSINPKWSESNQTITGKISVKFQSLIDSIPLAYGSIQDVYEPDNTDHPTPVVLIQDVHLNAEAQSNIASVLQALIDQKQIGLMGVEGVFGRYDFKPFRMFSDKNISRDVSQSFVDKGLLGAPSFVGISSVVEPPPFLGVDDEHHYNANVKAFLSTERTKPSVQRQLSELNRGLAQAKEKIFSPELKQFDDLRIAYHQKNLSIGVYVKKLTTYGMDYDFVVEQFLAAFSMESAMDFQRVERERRSVIEKLSQALNEKEIALLVSQSLAYRVGKLGFGTYYRNLKNLCYEKKIHLSNTPAFENYIRYVLLSDGIKAEDLFQAIQKMEGSVLNNLAATSEQKALALASEQLSLMAQLIDFSLTPSEWEQYTHNRQSPTDIAKTISASLLTPLTVDPKISLNSYEDFYREADIRSHKIVENLTTQNGASNKALLVGGFHTPQIAKLLRKQKIPYVVVSPKITKIDEKAGSSYLSVFAQEKTPLDKLFSGEKLFVKPDFTEVATQRGESIGALLRAVVAVETGGPNVTTIGGNTYELTVLPAGSEAHNEQVIFDRTAVKQIAVKRIGFRNLIQSAKSIIKSTWGIVKNWFVFLSLVSLPNVTSLLDIVIASDATRLEHEAYHQVGRFKDVINEIGREISARRDSDGNFDLREAVRKAGSLILTPYGELRIEADGILVVIDKRFQKDHAGRGRRAVYATDESKAQHELAELRAWIDFAKKPQPNGVVIATPEEISDGKLGQKLRDWVNGNGESISDADLIKRQEMIFELADRFHELGLQAESLQSKNNMAGTRDVINAFRQKTGRNPSPQELEFILWSADSDPTVVAAEMGEEIHSRNQVKGDGRLATLMMVANPLLEVYLELGLPENPSHVSLDPSKVERIAVFSLGSEFVEATVVGLKIDGQPAREEVAFVRDITTNKLVGVYLLVNQNDDEKLFLRLNGAVSNSIPKKVTLTALSRHLTQAWDLLSTNPSVQSNLPAQSIWGTPPVLTSIELSKLINRSALKQWVLTQPGNLVNAGENFLLFRIRNLNAQTAITMGEFSSNYNLVTGNNPDTLTHELAHSLYAKHVKNRGSARQYRLSPGLQRFVAHMHEKRKDLIQAMRGKPGYEKQFSSKERVAAQELPWDHQKSLEYSENTAGGVIDEIFARLWTALDSNHLTYDDFPDFPISSADLEAAVDAGLLPQWYSPSKVQFNKENIDDSYFLAVVKYLAENPGMDGENATISQLIAIQLKEKYQQLIGAGHQASVWILEIAEKLKAILPFTASNHPERNSKRKPLTNADVIIASDGSKNNNDIAAANWLASVLVDLLKQDHAMALNKILTEKRIDLGRIFGGKTNDPDIALEITSRLKNADFRTMVAARIRTESFRNNFNGEQAIVVSATLIALGFSNAETDKLLSALNMGKVPVLVITKELHESVIQGRPPQESKALLLSALLRAGATEGKPMTLFVDPSLREFYLSLASGLKAIGSQSTIAVKLTSDVMTRENKLITEELERIAGVKLGNMVLIIPPGFDVKDVQTMIFNDLIPVAAGQNVSEILKGVRAILVAA